MCYNGLIMIDNKNKLKDRFLSIIMDKNMKEQLKSIARKKEVGVSTLSRIWLAEKLQNVG